MVSRRNFIRAAGLLAASPAISRLGYAAKPLLPAIAAGKHKILTCNIRVDLPEDEQAGFGWNGRKEICAAIMLQQKPDIICMQEVLRNQNEDLKKVLKGYFSFGFEGPEMDAFTTGYHGIAKNPIFFSEKRYELLSAGGYWLSETPLMAGSLSWDSARARNANWVRLKDRQSGKDFRVVNLHLDHKSQPAREKQMEMVLADAAQYPRDYPQLLAGDFNASAENKVYELVISAKWKDTYTTLHGEAEPGYPVHQFQGENYAKKGKKIDFIFCKGEVTAQSAGILKDNVKGKYPSDHYFVSAEVMI
ncbi:endonuclease/exonuclease/phosphatase family metal-dependent hydrolase [Pedobacter sp. AK017]|uniref:endonuclease/exonuclease/phosphatase family protein n=1 Tax=Pedobacter sp. AK017 TaxID=2723073 RepID=UPI00161F6B63|nr:endonuclease/exonuclease/phosphatase family protein [Pedobacter sp. AK017]MBB5439827.1 endonuclease/exonuclease/phosphatase family metal-dependent hydrolase [Pedobacter sp. AK017]